MLLEYGEHGGLGPVVNQRLQAIPIAGGIVQLNHRDQMIRSGVCNKGVQCLHFRGGASERVKPNDSDGIGPGPADLRE